MFCKYYKKLGLFRKEQSAFSTENSLSKVEIAIAKNRSHSSIIATTEKMEKLDNPTFGFDFTSYDETIKKVKNSNSFSKNRYSCKNYQGKLS